VSGALTNENEIKWIRDWTGLMEISIEIVLSGCADPEWKAKFDYMSEFSTLLVRENLSLPVPSIRLSSSFIDEGLLETTHFCEWVLSNFEQSTLEELPLRLLMLQIYWQPITASLQTGRCLARVCMMKVVEA